MIRVAYVREENEIQIDIDGKRALTQFQKRYQVFRRRMQTYGDCGFFQTELLNTKSKTKNHWHVRIIFHFQISDLEALALAAALGDDPIRVICNLLRVLAGRRSPILFFEKEKRDNGSSVEHSSKTIQVCKGRRR